jgi:hypothetical protein
LAYFFGGQLETKLCREALFVSGCGFVYPLGFVPVQHRDVAVEQNLRIPDCED